MLYTSLDIEHPDSLLTYLRSTSRIAPDESPRIEILKGGVSNRTVLVERPTGESWVLKQALPKLRTQADWYSDPARIEREATGIRWLSKLAPPGSITPLCFTDFDRNLLCMRAVPQPHDNWKSLLLSGRVLQDHVVQFGTLLGTIHRRGYECAAEASEVFDDRSFFESLRLEPYFTYTASRVPAAATQFLNDLVADTRDRRLTIVHGDYSPKNVLVRQGQLILLDHEVIHFGDPAFDVGFAMAHLLSKAHHMPAHRAALATGARMFWTAYAAEFPLAPGLDEACARQALGCLLARVAGRSPLEYLTEKQRDHQRRVVIEMLKSPPNTINELCEEFLIWIEQWP